MLIGKELLEKINDLKKLGHDDQFILYSKPIHTLLVDEVIPSWFAFLRGVFNLTLCLLFGGVYGAIYVPSMSLYQFRC